LETFTAKPSAFDARSFEGLVDLVGVAPARVSRVQVDLRVLEGLELGDRVGQEVVALLLELGRSAAVHQVQQASGSRITVAARSRDALATASIQARYASPSPAPPWEYWPQSRCGML
jgi:hypothetical protein